MWIWFVLGLILVFIMITATERKPETSEKSRDKEKPSLQLGEIDDRYVESFDEEDELLEEFLIIDLLDEEDEEKEP